MVSACGLAANKEGAWVLQNTIIRLCRRHGRCRQVSRGHLVPARLSRPYSYRQAGRWRRPLALLRLRIPDGVFQSLADDPETLCRRALGQALGAGLLRTVAVDGDYQEIRFELDAEPWAAPCRRRGPDELPTAVVEKPWDSRCACVNSDVITRAWRRRSISVRSGARSLFTTPMRQSQPPRRPRRFLFFPRHDSATLLRISVPVPP